MLKRNPFHFSIATRVRNPYFKRFLEPSDGASILDVGCGVGYFTALLSEAGGDVCGVDVDPSSISVATQMIGNKFVIGSAEWLPFQDNSFDKILCSEVLEHIVDDNRAVSEIRRVAKPGAVIVLTVPSPEGLFGARIKSICHGHDDIHGPEAHQRDGYTRSELRTLLESNGILIDNMRFTMVAMTELLMGATKLAYLATSGNAHLSSQSEVMQVDGFLVFRAYRVALPIITALAKVEDIVLAPLLKGHMLIVKGKVQK